MEILNNTQIFTTNFETNSQTTSFEGIQLQTCSFFSQNMHDQADFNGELNLKQA